MDKGIDYRAFMLATRLYGRWKIIDSLYVYGAVKVIYGFIGITSIIIFVTSGLKEVFWLFITIVCGLAYNACIGIVVRRKRPTKQYGGKSLIKLLPFEYWKSFPSDHALIITILLINVLPFLSLTLALVAILLWAWVLISRVYVGVHFVSDVLVGAFNGLLVQLMMGTIG